MSQKKLTTGDLWTMAAEITEAQRKALAIASDSPIDWRGLEETWFDWLEEKLLEQEE